MLTIAFALAATMSAITPAQAQAQRRCHAIDGDTLACGSERVRIMGLDTPEMRGQCAAEIGTGIKQAVTDLILSAEQAVATAEANAMDRKRRGYPSFWREGRGDLGETSHYGRLVADSYSVPEADGRIYCAREKRLSATGWRFLPVPKLVKRRAEDKHRTPLEWDAFAGWLAIPPESSEHAARSFPKKGLALSWAEARA